VVLTFPGLPPSILITLELIRSISGRCTRLDAMVDGLWSIFDVIEAGMMMVWFYSVLKRRFIR
jgi:hypothetical protein